MCVRRKRGGVCCAPPAAYAADRAWLRADGAWPAPPAALLPCGAAPAPSAAACCRPTQMKGESSFLGTLPAPHGKQCPTSTRAAAVVAAATKDPPTKTRAPAWDRAHAHCPSILLRQSDRRLNEWGAGRPPSPIVHTWGDTSHSSSLCQLPFPPPLALARQCCAVLAATPASALHLLRWAWPLPAMNPWSVGMPGQPLLACSPGRWPTCHSPPPPCKAQCGPHTAPSPAPHKTLPAMHKTYKKATQQSAVECQLGTCRLPTAGRAQPCVRAPAASSPSAASWRLRVLP